MSENRQSVGAIWIRRSEKGSEYFSISLNGESYVAFLNDYKQDSKHPDYKIYLSRKMEGKSDDQKRNASPSDIPF